jgi:hypothetical protein
MKKAIMKCLEVEDVEYKTSGKKYDRKLDEKELIYYADKSHVGDLTISVEVPVINLKPRQCRSFIMYGHKTVDTLPEDLEYYKDIFRLVDVKYTKVSGEEVVLRFYKHDLVNIVDAIGYMIARRNRDERSQQ